MNFTPVFLLLRFELLFDLLLSNHTVLKYYEHVYVTLFLSVHGSFEAVESCLYLAPLYFRTLKHDKLYCIVYIKLFYATTNLCKNI